MDFNRDKENLRLLGLFHYIYAGLGLLGLGFIAGHYYLFSRFFTDPEFLKNAKDPPPEGFLDLFIWIYIIMAVFMLIGMLLNSLCAYFIRQHRRRIFCMIVAGLNCMNIPLGLVIGIFTLVFLTRESVIPLFDTYSPSDPSTSIA
jgi:hypothetical protein